ncbi:MAG: hypothetical protein DIZ78_15355 [endosymbiont of Escarpia spicata]|uniref:WbqC family protein n=1 Tax=endosymbiont of Escarpia spicata TaxID=2200908 RepID=A0A370DEN1_9GAMM|nr:MAG: hypothetical protein DIZ78_15355 [endosymbiont of Escarpia spicata]
MSKIGAIIQSSYFPWKGYFDMVHDVDLFVFMDDVQFTTRDWRNRNLIKTERGPLWLTVPVGAKRSRLIQDVEINQYRWQKEHYKSLKHHYGKAPFFHYVEALINEIFLGEEWDNLSQVNQHVIKIIAQQYLGIRTDFINAGSLNVTGIKTERLIEICKATGITHYLSGPTAKNYIEPSLFDEAGIKLVFKDYSDYPEYQQLHPPFSHNVSILDLLVHAGPDASHYIWGFRDAKNTRRGR